MKRAAGCCPACGGSGASGEECTGGACWDCQATGHPHLGPCGFWRWWLNHSLDLLLVLFVIMAAGAVVVGALESEWVTWVYVAVTLPWWCAWVALEKAYDRRVRRRVWN